MLLNMQLDYNYHKVYSKWRKGEKGIPEYDLLYVELTLYTNEACEKVNSIFETYFEIQKSERINIELAEKILDYLQNNHFYGIYGDNCHELASEYWGWRKY